MKNDGTTRAGDGKEPAEDAARNPERGMTGRRFFVAALCFMFLLVVVFFFKPLLTRETIFFGDFTYIFQPYHHTVATSLRNGELPLWNPYNNLGYSMVGDPQSHVLYPPAWLLALTPFGKNYMWFIFLHYFAAGAGALLLLLRMGRTPAAALFGAVAFAFSGLYVSIHIFGHVFSALWMPLVLWSLLRLRDRPSVSSLGAAGLITALMITGGEMQIVYFFALYIGIYFLWTGRGGILTAPGAKRHLPLAGAAVFALLAAAPFLLSVANFMTNTVRFGEPNYEIATMWSVHPLRLYSMIAVNPFGMYKIDPYYWHSALMAYGEMQPSAASLYMGVTVVMMCALAVARKTRATAFFWATALLFLLLSLGEFTRVYEIFFYHFPLMKRFNYPYKFLMIFWLSMSVLASYGFDAFLELARDRKIRPWMIAALFALPAALQAAGHYACVLKTGSPGFVLPGDAESVSAIQAHLVRTLAVSLGIAAAAAVSFFVVSRRAGAWPLVVALLAAELYIGGARTVWTIPESEFNRTPSTFSIMREHDDSPLHEFRYHFVGWDRLLLNVDKRGYDGLVRINAKKRDFLQPNINQVFGAHSPWFYISYLPSTYVQTTMLYKYSNYRTMDLFNVRYVVSSYEYAFADKPGDETLPLVGRDEKSDLYVYENPTAYPRAYWSAAPVYVRGDRASEEAVYDLIGTLKDNPVIELDYEEAIPQLPPAPGASADVKISEYRMNSVKVEVDAPADGYLVLLDAYDPGWRAMIGGAAARVRRANRFFRAVRVPRGKHTVAFYYSPKPFRTGAAVSVITILLWIGVLAGRKMLGKKSS